jgi:ABC-type uncharacterized transport system substrate-binding protein
MNTVRKWLTASLVFMLVFTLVGCGGGQTQPSNKQTQTTAAKEAPKVDSASKTQSPAKKYKILHLMSFNSPYEWTDTQLSGFQEQLKDLDVEYKVLQLDTNKNNTDELKAKVIKEATDLIETWKPDLVYTSDDDAQKYLTTKYINKDIPFVYSGVNQTPEFYGFDKAANVTGVLETEHFVESVNVLKQLVPAVKKIAIIYDEGAQWVPMVERMKAREKQLQGVEVVGYDKITTYDEYQKKIKDYENKVDALGLIGVFNIKDKDGKNVPKDVILKWTAENSKLPDFSFWKDRISFGTLAAMTVSGVEQGKAAGKIARQILLEGKKPNEIKPQATTIGEPVVNQARLNALGIKADSNVLLTLQIIKDYEWNKK